MFNRAMGLGLDEPATEELVDEALDFLESTRSYVSLTPDAGPAELRGWLQARGLTPGYGWTKFVRPAADPPEGQTTLGVERVENGDARLVVACGVTPHGEAGRRRDVGLRRSRFQFRARCRSHGEGHGNHRQQCAGHASSA